jgi:hypothetical protein
LNGLKDIHFTIKNAPSPRALKTATYYSTSLGNRKVTSDTTIANPDKSIIARYATSLDER